MKISILKVFVKAGTDASLMPVIIHICEAEIWRTDVLCQARQKVPGDPISKTIK
jgi:hypothetical protein